MKQRDRTYSEPSVQTVVQICKEIRSSVSWQRPFCAFDNAQFISQFVQGMGASGSGYVDCNRSTLRQGFASGDCGQVMRSPIMGNWLFAPRCFGPHSEKTLYQGLAGQTSGIRTFSATAIPIHIPGDKFVQQSHCCVTPASELMPGNRDSYFLGRDSGGIMPATR